MPSIQSLQLGMRRVSFELLRDGEKEKAMTLVDKYFESFPHKNFPYDYRTMMMLDVMYQANEYQKASLIWRSLLRKPWIIWNILLRL